MAERFYDVTAARGRHRAPIEGRRNGPVDLSAI